MAKSQDHARGKRFDEQKTYWLKGDTLNALWEEIRKSRALGGLNTSITETPDGRQVHSKGGALPKHPWELYRNGDGWSVYPATVNGVHLPTLGGVSLFDPVPPVALADGSGDLSLYLEFDVDCEATEASDGTFFALSGSEELSNVIITGSPGTQVDIEVDPDTGAVTPGHYVHLLGTVAGGEKTSQPQRFSLYFTLCAGGGLLISSYG